jgi:MFS transporter, OFA family, oxalate/formate antiporter
MSRRAMAVLAAGFLTVSAAYGIRYGYGMLLPEMLPALGIGKAEAGLIYAAYFLAYTLFSPVLGRLSDRCDVRRLLTFFSALLGLGAFLMGRAVSLGTACLFFVLAGIGHSACWAPVVSLVQRWVDDRRRGAALAFATLGSGAGIAFWSLALPFIVERFDWRAGWMAMGGFAFCIAVLNFILVRNDPPADPVRDPLRDPPPDPPEVSYWGLLRRSALWRVGFAYLFVGFTVIVPYTFLGVYATEGLGLPYATATRFVTVIAVSAMVGKLVLGVLSDRVGRVGMMMVCDLLLGAGCLGMAGFRSPGGIFAAAGIFGLGFGAVWPIYAAAALDFFPRKLAGSVVGIWTLFLGAGSMLSPVLCGWSIDRTGEYGPAFLMGLAGAGVSALFLVGLRTKTNGAPVPDTTTDPTTGPAPTARR